jgi:hypothetical protein
VRFTLLGVAVWLVDVSGHLSPALEARMPAVLDRVLEELAWNSSR